LKHRLDPLLRPKSVAIVGASGTVDTIGHWALKNLLKGGYRGTIYPVNPRYDELQGVRCFASLAALPEVPDMLMFAVADHRIEAVLDEAIVSGIPAAVLMSTLVQDDDCAPLLKERVQKKIRAAGMLVCGANGMGFYNVRDHVWACGFDSRVHEAPGNVSLISHSGSGMSGIVDCEERIRFNFACSAGNELAVSMDEYLDFVLELPETRVVGLFVETARNPQGFRAALQKAAERRIPIVALKVGRTERSAQLTVSHSGAIAGDDATYHALFDRYGVQRVRDMDELATALILFAGLHPVGAGGVVSLHDSGGERQLMVDLCDEAGVPLTDLGESTVAALEKILDPELPAVNPLDAWSRGGPAAGKIMSDALTAMMQDPGAAMGVVMHDRAPDGVIYQSYVEYMRIAQERSGKPVALVAARQGSGCDKSVVSSTHAGLPVLDGLPSFLRGVRALLDYRDFCKRQPAPLDAAPAWAIAKWRDRLAGGRTLDEVDALAMLGDFGLPVSPSVIACNEAEAIAAATSIGYPLVLKTAMPGMPHKTEHRGVFPGLANEAQLIEKYNDILQRLGARVLLAPMAAAGVEMLLGVKRDPQFGPVVLFGFGGILAELTRDVAFALPPFDAAYARGKLDKLKLRPLLDGLRGKHAADIAAYCRMASDFSVMVDALRVDLLEVDVNPVIVGETSCIAVDALVVGRNGISGDES
jgi:acyl-CoA synthetase (NDP forming)